MQNHEIKNTDTLFSVQKLVKTDILNSKKIVQWRTLER